jgi:hypothetical protein
MIENERFGLVLGAKTGSVNSGTGGHKKASKVSVHRTSIKGDIDGQVMDHFHRVDSALQVGVQCTSIDANAEVDVCYSWTSVICHKTSYCR